MKDDFHKTAGASDKLWALAELEHLRRHLLRGYVASAHEEKAKQTYLIWANRAQKIRRELQGRWFPDLNEKDWCTVKSAVSLRQLSYELFVDDYNALVEMDDFLDDILSDAVKADLSACSACREDKSN